MVKQEFLQIYDPKRTVCDDFDENFHQLRNEAEARAEEMKKSKQAVRPSKKQGQITVRNAGSQGCGKQESSGVAAKDGDDGDSAKGRGLENGNSNGRMGETRPPVAPNSKENGSTEVGAFDVNKLQKLRSKAGKKTDTAVSEASKVEPKKKITKKNRVWDDSPAESKLDFTDPIDERGDGYVDVVAADQGESMMDKEEIMSSESEAEEDEEVNIAKSSTKKKGWFSSVFQSITGNVILEKADLEQALKTLKDRLMTKNVAEEIAEKLCESVAASLEDSNGRGSPAYFNS